MESASDNLLHDDFERLAGYCGKLRENGGGNVDVIVDNAGFELITDLALAQHRIESGIASCVTFQLKSHVSLLDSLGVYDMNDDSTTTNLPLQSQPLYLMLSTKTFENTSITTRILILKNSQMLTRQV